MPIKSEPSTPPPPPRIGKIGPYTVFVTPPATPNPSPKPESPSITAPVQKKNQAPSPPPVMAPPAQFYKEKPSSFAFFWDAAAKVQNAHATLDEHVARWFGLNQSRYQWALDDYYENNEKNQTQAKPQVKASKLENV
ncbi:Non-specific serine/threonine protein kinase [Handroanthus impetiginosus]|uniref:Non-specific serine/threonine protein kinase n=1 Tax=Handroanthus impetiginosus TaxID=429701 RepID=A0A2G9GTR0_9LAMI|nr:Non-specific serine/threonine protein kinase [Handroanthus impetiginosus]